MDNYEEKYKKALNWMQGLYKGLHGKTKKEAEEVFPELAESEDEKIRKELIKIVNDHYSLFKEIDRAKTIAWLEKQGEQPTDKVEPKFKVGDWIIGRATNNEPRQISEITDQYYKSTYGGQYGFSFEDGMHLWTIQEAKDGDVLSWDDSECIALFKNIFDKDSFNSHGFVGHLTGAFESGLRYHDIEGAHPATKEQRDFLFQKMREAGFEWDAEKKELKEIEQKPEGKPLISLKDFQKAFELKVKQYEINLPNRGYDIHAMCKELYSLLTRQKPAEWSEEDEMHLKHRKENKI